MGQLLDKGPLRKVVGRSYDADRRPLDVMDCGHVKVMDTELVHGRVVYSDHKRRRCPQCAALLAATLASSVR